MNKFGLLAVLVQAVKEKIYEEPLKHTEIVKLENLTDDELYDKSKVDKNGVPYLRKIEKYPDLPDDVFVPFEYTSQKSKRSILSGVYFINKKGQIKSKLSEISKNGRNPDGIIKSCLKNGDGYITVDLRIDKNNRKTIKIRLHRALSLTFFINPNTEVYSNVNHINCIRDDNRLENLEWVTLAVNSSTDKKSGNRKEPYTKNEFVALNDNMEEVFRVALKDCWRFKYTSSGIKYSISVNKKYKGYYWRHDKYNIILNSLGFNYENIDSYTWEILIRHPNYSVCKEGFIKDNRTNEVVMPYLDNNGYLLGTIDKNSIRLHRIIAEHIFNVYLDENNVVDHINTNKWDNSFSNLRITNYSGNMSSPLTKMKNITEMVFTDLFGDFITYGSSTDFAKEVLNNYKNNKVTDYIKRSIIESKYSCIKIGDLETLKKKLDNIIYVFTLDKTVAVSAYVKVSNIVSKLGTKMTATTFSKYYINTNRNLCGYIFLRGKEAVNLLEKLGHLTAAKYNPNNDPEYWRNKLKEKDNINDFTFSELESIVKIRIKESLIEDLDLSKLIDNDPPDKMKTIKQYDFLGNFILQYRGVVCAGKKNNCEINPNYLSSGGYLWCLEGDENIIKVKLKYIFYKFDKNGNIINSTNNFVDKPNVKMIRKYLNTGMLAPDGFYYQQGIDFIEPDPDNIDLIPKRPILKWKDRAKNNQSKDTK